MKYLSQNPIQNKRVLLRVDYNVSLTPTHTIADDERIRESLPTIKKLLHGNNRLIIVSHLGRPDGTHEALSLKPIQKKLQEYLPDVHVTLIPDFQKETSAFETQTPNDILLLENIRFFQEEERNDPEFAKKLALLADVYVNEAFSVDHRKAASTVGVTAYLPSYAGLSLEEEITYLSKVLAHPQHPFIAIIGGGKISTKLILLEKLLTKVDFLLVGGGIANTLLKAQGKEIGKSICEENLLSDARRLLLRFAKKIVLPIDVTVETESKDIKEKTISNLLPTDIIRDIGSQTIHRFSQQLSMANTIVWNGPLGFFEEKPFDHGTQQIYSAVANNNHALSIVGGGDTIAALSLNSDFHQSISHISTGGGAMLAFLQNGTLPGIEALEKNNLTERSLI